MNCSCGCGGTNGCFKEKLAYMRANGVQLTPSATPNRTRRNAAPSDRSNSNAWERGVVKDERGLPYLDSHLEPIGTKEWANNPSFKEELRRIKASPVPLDQARK